MITFSRSGDASRDRSTGMDKLFLKLIDIFPTYADALLRLVTGPKRFIEERVSRNELEIGAALVFLAVSIFLTSILSLPLHKGDPLVVMGVNLVFNITGFIAVGLCLCSAWRCVGGHADLKLMLSVTFYFVGVWTYINNLTNLLTLSAFKELSTPLYEAYYDVLYAGCSASSVLEAIDSRKDIIASDLVKRLGVYGALSLSVSLACLAVIPHALWLFIGWGAYRRLNGASRFRSFIAFTLFILFLVPVFPLLGLAGLQAFRAFALEPGC